MDGANNAAYEQVIARFVAWAQGEEDLRAAFVVGSRARRDHPADAWSDLDVIMLVDDPEPYISTADWLHHVGVPWLTFVERTPDGVTFERRVLFEGGLDVDLVPIPVAHFRRMAKDGLPPDDLDLVRRGVRVLLDKDGLLNLSVDELEPVEAAMPAEPEFLNLVHDFWYHTVWAAKKLRRGELWTAKSCSDSYLKHLLLRMLEWHARASRGPETDTWMRGRFLEEWADPRAVAALPEVFAHYEEEDVWRALMATMDLFHRLAVETAESLGYGYPSFGEARAAELVQAFFTGRERSRE